MQKYKSKELRFITAVLIIGYLIGTMTHVIHFLEVVRLGFENSAQANGVSLLVNGYWLSLTIINPFIAFLLFKKTKTGVLLAFINIVINVMVNSSIQIASLSVITLYTVYEALGNIYNGLQIALLVFSTFTLPLFFLKPNHTSSRSSNYLLFFNFIPVIALTIGLLIHLAGLLTLIRNFESLWFLWVHVLMAIVTTGLMYALWKRIRLGYILGIIAFSFLGLLQAGFAGAIFIGFDYSFTLAMAITISICCLSVSSLLMRREKNSEIVS
ncbi:hypothetical protein QA601_03595 [Chitinispirillales bacterium ANBcel5]|uniref:hypothetical protein n=1 Tax=Cellulosispirillum alkaliphilum TaxID=3039283 RepID=UPI002A55523A|nr:hypothetical protein [Chitinispirillales bacterium ANBcel5]